MLSRQASGLLALAAILVVSDAAHAFTEARLKPTTPRAPKPTNPAPPAPANPVPTNPAPATPSLPADALSIQSHANGATVSGTVQLQGRAGSQWVNVVAFDGNDLGNKVSTDVTPSRGTYTLPVDTTKLQDGTQTLSVIAFSVAAGQPGGVSSEASIRVWVQNGATTPPPAPPTTPAPTIPAPAPPTGGQPTGGSGPTPPANARTASCPTTGDAQSCLQSFFNGGSSSDTYYIPQGTYRHSGNLNIKGKVMGAGAGKTILYGTNTDAKSVYITQSGTTLSYLGITTATSPRGDQPGNTAIFVDQSVSGFEISHVEVYGRGGSAALLVFGGSNGKIHNNYIHDTNADCFHNTHRAHDNEYWNNVTNNCGDDSFALVGYEEDTMPYNIHIHDNSATNQTHGRGYACVGGRNSVIENNYYSTGPYAGIYVAAEPAYGSVACHDLVVRNNTIKNGGNSSSGHSAILVWNGSNSRNLKNITFTGNQGFRPAIGQFIRFGDPGSPISGVTVTNNVSYQDGGSVLVLDSTPSSLTNTGNSIRPSSSYPGDQVAPKTGASVLAQ